MVFLTDKSVLVSGLKHASTESYRLWLKFLEDQHEIPVHTFDQGVLLDKNLFQASDLTLLIRISEILAADVNIKSYEDLVNKSRSCGQEFMLDYRSNIFFKKYNPVEEVFFNKQKPIFIFIREPKSSLKSALVEDFLSILSVQKNKLENKRYVNQYLDLHYNKTGSDEKLHTTLPDFKYFDKVINEIYQEFTTEVFSDKTAFIPSSVTFYHTNTYHLTSIVKLLINLSNIDTKILQNVKLVNLNEIDDKLKEYLISMNAIHPRYDTKKDKHSKQEIYSKLDEFFDRIFVENINCITRFEQERISYKVLIYTFNNLLVNRLEST